MTKAEIVPGLAEAIEARRRQQNLNPTTFAKHAGVTLQGLAPLRRGERRNYQEKLKLGVARALGWSDDSVDRLLEGRPPLPVAEARAYGDHEEGYRRTAGEALRSQRETVGLSIDDAASAAAVRADQWAQLEAGVDVRLTEAERARISSVVDWDAATLTSLLVLGDADGTNELAPYLTEGRIQVLEERMEMVLQELDHLRRLVAPERADLVVGDFAVAAEGAMSGHEQRVGPRAKRPSPEPEPEGP